MKKLFPIVASVALLAGCTSTQTSTTKVVSTLTQVSISSIETISSYSSISNTFSIKLDGKEKTFDLTNTGVKIDFGKIIENKIIPSGDTYTGYEYSLTANLASKEGKLLSQQYSITSGEKILKDENGNQYKLVFFNNIENLKNLNIGSDIVATPILVENFEGGILETNLEGGECAISFISPIFFKNGIVYNFTDNSINGCADLEKAQTSLDNIKSIIKTIK